MTKYLPSAIFFFLALISINLSLESSDHSEEASRQLNILKRKNKSYSYHVAATAIFKNEARFIKEWIEYHRLIGVEHFYLYNNQSTDHYLDILMPYITKGIVSLKDWNFDSINHVDWNVIQSTAYEDAIKLCEDKAMWLAIIDLDEFIVPVETDNLYEALKPYEDCGGVVVNWQMYGTSNVRSVPADKLMIETLLMKAPTLYGENCHLKSIVRPSRVASVTNPHHANYKGNYFQVNTNRVRTANSISPDILTDKIRINHYWTRDEEFFENEKIARRSKWMEGYEGMLERKNNLNQVEDQIMLRFVPKLKKKMKKKIG